MRGTLNEIRFDPFGGGIIPADAGNTIGLCVGVVDPQDHPRGCGEHRQARLSHR